MAKEQRGFKTTNSMIDSEELKLIETTKEGLNVFDIKRLLDEWHLVEGISFNITLNKDVEPHETDY